jgi:drug/metabolite transporter (DMT)-like permease
MNKGMNSTSVAFYQFVFSIIFLGAILFYNSPKDFKVNGFFIAILIVVGLLNALGNFFLFKSLSLVDNSGYAIAIANLNVVLILFASIFLFGVKLDMLKIVGTLLVVSGVVLIGLK